MGGTTLIFLCIFRKEEKDEEANHKNEVKEIKLSNRRLENEIRDIRAASLEMKTLLLEEKYEEANHENEVKEIILINRRLENEIRDMKTLLLEMRLKEEEEKRPIFI